MATTSQARNGTRNGSSSTTRRSPQPKLGQRGAELQRFGTLRQLPIALSAEARTESCQLVNAILADTTILYALYKKAHWNAAGPTFYQLHLLFDKHAEEQGEQQGRERQHHVGQAHQPLVEHAARVAGDAA